MKMVAPDGKDGKDGKAATPVGPKPVSYLKLYSRAERLDWVLIAFAVAGAIVNGVTMPLFTVVFGAPSLRLPRVRCPHSR